MDHKVGLGTCLTCSCPMSTHGRGHGVSPYSLEDSTAFLCWCGDNNNDTRDRGSSSGPSPVVSVSHFPHLNLPTILCDGQGEETRCLTRNRKDTCQSELMIVLADFHPGERHFIPILQMRKLRFQEVNRIPISGFLGIRDNANTAPNRAWYTQNVLGETVIIIMALNFCGRKKGFCSSGAWLSAAVQDCISDNSVSHPSACTPVGNSTFPLAIR